MSAVEFRRDLNRQAFIAKRLGRVFSIRCCGKKIPTHREEDFSPARVHRLDRLDGVIPWILRRIEMKFGFELIQKFIARPFPNTHRAVALHVAMTANRAHPGAGLTDGAAQEQQVDDLLNRGDGIMALGQSHRPADDDAVGGYKQVGGFANLIARDTAVFDDFIPVHQS